MNTELTNKRPVGQAYDIEVEGWDADLKKYVLSALRTDAEDDDEAVDVAYINLKGEIEYLNGFTEETAPDVKETVRRYTEDFLFSSDPEKAKEGLAKMVYNGWRPSELLVRNPDGTATYAMEEVDILGNKYVYAGLYESDSDNDRRVPVRYGMTEDEMKENAESLADWLIEDITSAVGDEWLIEPSSY